MIETMKKERFLLVCLGTRDGMFYYKDKETGSRKSLKTRDPEEADLLIQHKNLTAHDSQTAQMNRQIGMAYLSGSDPALTERVWQDVMDDIIKDKQGPTLRRWETAIKDGAFDLIRNQVVATTQAGDLKAVLRKGTISTNVYLRRLQNHCLDMGWLPARILPKKQFPKIEHKEQRAITWREHRRIVAREGNPERRDYYELCWYFGGSQSDIANLQAEDFDYERQNFTYDRLKNSNLSGSRIGPKAWKVILRRPRSGPLFPYLITLREADRATEFKQRCEGLEIQGVTLHSYRYAWAERSADNGYPERYAQRVLGQNSKIVHRAYAKKAQKELPSLEEYEEAARKAKKEGKVVVTEHEFEMPKVK
jgi:integrase